MKKQTIALLTDFGLKDPYVGIMKGVILRINPHVCLVDITHEISPGQVFQASLILEESFLFFPKGTIFLGVVDPGVGTRRRPIVVVHPDYVFVGPDNGLFYPALSHLTSYKIYHITATKYFLSPLSNTFHGRDIFAPVSAHLSMGLDPRELGPEIGDLVKLQAPVVKEEKGILQGQVVRIDRFGNLITNISSKIIEDFIQGQDPEIEVGHLVVKGIKKSYGDVPKGHPLALIGSNGFMEIAVNGGQASALVEISDQDLGEHPVVVKVKWKRD